jgi:hypothetical protein
MAARRNYGKVGLVRLTSWATAAAVAMTIAALTVVSPAGSQRVAVAIAALTGADTPRARTQLAAQQAGIDSERRSLYEAIRLLAADRDQLHGRVVSLERNLDDITGSIKSQLNARPLPPSTSLQREPQQLATSSEELPQIVGTVPAKSDDRPDWLANAPEPWPSPSSAMEFAPAPAIEATELPPAEDAAASLDEPRPVRVTVVPPVSQPEAPTAVTRTVFGVDIGSGNNLKEVRFLWNKTKAKHGRLIGKLRPVVSKSQNGAGHSEYRLVIGPLANAAAAARLCADLGAADVTCSARPYQGENLTP